MSEDKNPLKRRDPPSSDDEWIYLFDGIEKAHLSWPITAPFVAVVNNWKGLLVVIFVVLGLNAPRILEALLDIGAVQSILGVTK